MNMNVYLSMTARRILKAAYSTAGRGVRRAATRAEAVSAWRALGGAGTAGDPVKVMVQAPAAGAYRQVAALFDRGRLIAAACSQRIGPGAGGSAAWLQLSQRVCILRTRTRAILRPIRGENFSI